MTTRPRYAPVTTQAAIEAVRKQAIAARALIVAVRLREWFPRSVG